MKIMIEQFGYEWVAYYVFRDNEPGAVKEVGETPMHALEKLLKLVKGDEE